MRREKTDNYPGVIEARKIKWNADIWDHIWPFPEPRNYKKNISAEPLNMVDILKDFVGKAVRIIFNETSMDVTIVEINGDRTHIEVEGSREALSIQKITAVFEK